MRISPNVEPPLAFIIGNRENMPPTAYAGARFNGQASRIAMGW
jgi:hypothetical protein